jgi:hypothetical protein
MDAVLPRLVPSFVGFNGGASADGRCRLVHGVGSSGSLWIVLGRNREGSQGKGRVR